MKLDDIDKVNHLVAEMNSVKELIAHAERADPTDCELFIKQPGDASLNMSSEGASSTHYLGFSASPEFLARLKSLAIEEFNTKRRAIVAELAALGVEAEA